MYDLAEAYINSQQTKDTYTFELLSSFVPLSFQPSRIITNDKADCFTTHLQSLLIPVLNSNDYL